MFPTATSKAGVPCSSLGCCSPTRRQLGKHNKTRQLSHSFNGTNGAFGTLMKSRSTHTCAQRQTNKEHTDRSRRPGVLYAQKELFLGKTYRKLGPECPYSRHTAQHDRSGAAGIVGGKQRGFLCRPVCILLTAFLRRAVNYVY